MKTPTCHFKQMELQYRDGRFEVYECTHCKAQKEIETEYDED